MSARTSPRDVKEEPMNSTYSTEYLNDDKNPRIPDELIIQAFAKLDKTALGMAVGIICGAAIFAATLFLVFKGGARVGPNLALLGQFFIGYRVTLIGSVIGGAYGFVFGFVIGWLTAFLRNFFVATYVYTVKLKTNLLSINDFIGHL